MPITLHSWSFGNSWKSYVRILISVTLSSGSRHHTVSWNVTLKVEQLYWMKAFWKKQIQLTSSTSSFLHVEPPQFLENRKWKNQIRVYWDCLLTQCLLQLTLVGMLEDEEVVSGWVCGNPVGKLLGLCRFGVNQLNGLFLYIQPLRRNTHKQALFTGQVMQSPFHWQH